MASPYEVSEKPLIAFEKIGNIIAFPIQIRYIQRLNITAILNPAFLNTRKFSIGKFTEKTAAREPTVYAVIAERKYTLLGTLLIKNAVIGIVIPEINVAPLVSHCAKLDDTPKS